MRAQPPAEWGDSPRGSGKSGKEISLSPYSTTLFAFQTLRRETQPGSGHPNLTSFVAFVARLYVSHRKPDGGRSQPGRSLPEREPVLPGARGRGLQPLWVVGSDAETMLLRAAWRRAVWAVAAAVGPKPATPSRGLRLRGTLPIPLFATLPRGGLLSLSCGHSSEYSQASLSIAAAQNL